MLPQWNLVINTSPEVSCYTCEKNTETIPLFIEKNILHITVKRLKYFKTILLYIFIVYILLEKKKNNSDNDLSAY